MLPLRDPRSADVDAHLPAIGGVYQLRKGTAVIHIHLEGILELVRWQVGQIQRIKLLGKRSFRHFRHHERRRLLLKLLQQIHNLTQRDLMSHRHTAIAAILFQDSLHTIKFTVLLLAFQQIKHTFYEVVNVEQFQLRAAVVNCERFIVGHRQQKVLTALLYFGRLCPIRLTKR